MVWEEGRGGCWRDGVLDIRSRIQYFEQQDRSIVVQLQRVTAGGTP